MKKLILISLSILFLVLHTPAQSKTPKAPTQKEMDDAMQGMQKIMDGMSPEDKKMMEKMGVKIPSMNSMPKMSEQQMQNAMDIATRVVPPKDDARIASISKIPLTSSTLPAYLSASHTKVLAVLRPEAKTKGEELYQSFKKKNKSSISVGNSAASLWMMGKPELALYVLGKACIDDPANTDNRNNYASMLSMSGAEQLALPILNNLNKRFPKNSTILNNIGQAWFGLGDMDQAVAYLDSTIHLFPAHSQANATKSAIEESKGNKDAAVAILKKSLKEAYSEDKQDKLAQLGYEFDEKDIILPFKPKQDPLGLEKFNPPAIPKTVEESVILEKEWRQFKDECTSKIDQLAPLLNQARINATTATEKRQKEFMDGTNKQSIPYFASRVNIKLKALSTDADGTYTRRIATALQQLNDYSTNKASLTKDFDKAIAKLKKEEAKQDGEGKANADFCPRFVALENDYLKAYNTEWEQIHNEAIAAIRQKFNQETYYQLYTKWPEDFEVIRLTTQIQWISTLHDTYYLSINSPVCDPEKEVKKGKSGPLPDFDDIHCEYHSELSTPIGKISMDCSRLTAELDLEVVKLGIKQNMNKEGFSDQFMACSVEIGASKTIGTGDLGPLKAEASVGGSVKAEFDRNGLIDITAKAGVEAKAGIEIKGAESGGDVSLNAKVGLDAKISLISGHGSIEGAGTLSGMSKYSY